MADYLNDVRKYAPRAGAKTVEKIVKHLGGSLHNRDAAFVATHDPSEVATVRDHWCKKKLGVKDNAAIDAAIEHVAKLMKAQKDKPRVTVYYLLARHFGLLHTL